VFDWIDIFFTKDDLLEKKTEEMKSTTNHQ